MEIIAKGQYMSCSQTLQMQVRSVHRRVPNDAEITAMIVDDTLEISVCGELDLRLHTRLWGASRWNTERFAKYVFNLDRVTNLRDSGLAWLMMFNRQVLSRKSVLEFRNCPSAWQPRLQLAGLA